MIEEILLFSCRSEKYGEHASSELSLRNRSDLIEITLLIDYYYATTFSYNYHRLTHLPHSSVSSLIPIVGIRNEALLSNKLHFNIKYNPYLSIIYFTIILIYKRYLSLIFNFISHNIWKINLHILRV